MNHSIYRILLDIQGSSCCRLDAKQWDTHRRVQIDLTDGGIPYTITQKCFPVLMAKTSDNTLFFATCRVEDNTVLCDIPSDLTKTAGLVRCELRLYNAPYPPEAEGVELLTSAAFVIRVLPAVYTKEDEAALAGSDEGTALTQLVTDATQAIADLQTAKESGEFNGTSVTHNWEGTRLVVTSASGTSSEDLKGDTGEKGEKGDKGDQGEPGIVNINDSAIGLDAWSSKNIVDRLCPAICENGSVVQCNPVAGYPLEVTVRSDEPAVLTVCGKNLYNKDIYPLVSGKMIRYASGTYVESVKFSATETYIPVAHLRGAVLSIRNAPFTTEGSTNGGAAFYDENKVYISGSNGAQLTVPDNAAFIRFSVNTNYAAEAQIELGTAVTDYEAYRGIQQAGTSHITALEGSNTLFAYAGTQAVPLAVTGKADPIVIIEKLTNAVLALGVNI